MAYNELLSHLLTVQDILVWKSGLGEVKLHTDA